MYKLDNFKTCCDYLGIDNTLPVCQIDERQIQAAYKLRVCMKAWNRQDGFEPDEKATCLRREAGCTPHFFLDEGKLFPADIASSGSVSGIIHVNTNPGGAFSIASFGLRIVLSTEKQAVAFSRVFIETFNELI